MRTFILFGLIGVQLFVSAQAQVHWMGGGAIGSSPASVMRSGQIGLKAVPDRYWSLGACHKPSNGKTGYSFGVIATIQLRSPFYELDRAIPYYPGKVHVPTFRLESLQLYPFISIIRPLRSFRKVEWLLRTGAVFSFHNGNFLSTTTGQTQPDRRTFILYQLGVQRQPMGIPHWRTQLGLSCKLLDRKSWSCFIQPLIQFDLGDRSSISFQSVPDDPLIVSAGQMINRKWSVGFLCGFVKKR
jgi:hypothetical protein